MARSSSTRAASRSERRRRERTEQSAAPLPSDAGARHDWRAPDRAGRRRIAHPRRVWEGAGRAGAGSGWRAGAARPPLAAVLGVVGEDVEHPRPAVLVRAHGLLVPEVTVGEDDGRQAVLLGEVDLDQRPPGVAVPEPGEREARRRLDLGVEAAAGVLGARDRIAHGHAHGAADAQVHLRFARLPAALRPPPAAQHLLARPGVEDVPDRRAVCPFDAQVHRRRRRIITHARASRSAAVMPGSSGITSSTGTPATCAKTITRRALPGSGGSARPSPSPPQGRRTRRGAAATGTAASADSPPASPPTPPGARAP